MKQFVQKSLATIEEVFREEEERLVNEFGNTSIIAKSLPNLYSLMPTLYRKKAERWPKILFDSFI